MSNISGLAALRKKEAGGSDSDEEEKRKKQELYTGGVGAQGGGSGMAVLGPPAGRKGDPPGSDVFNKLVQAAQGAGAGEDGPPADEEMNTITMYSNGFTVNDGPLRDPQGSPENQAFIEELLKGFVPAELKRGRKDPSKPMNISLADKRQETYKAPAYTAFSSGTALGGTSASPAGSFTPAALPPAPALDDSAPATTIQVRTSGGKKLRLKVNTSITVAQLAALVVADTGAQEPFSLSAGFPPKDLLEPEATIEAAGLMGAAVTQR